MSRTTLLRLLAAAPLAAATACTPPAPPAEPAPVPAPAEPAPARPALEIVAEPPTLGAPRPYTLPPIEEFRLENGLRVVVVRQASVPLVTGRLILEAGAEHEPAERNGLAVLTANLLPEGTAALPGPELAERMERLGAQFQTGAGQNSTFAVVAALKPAFAEALGLAAQAVTAPAFPARDFERVKQQAITAHVQSQSTVEGLAAEAFARAVFAAQAPYARLPGGTAATLGQVTRDDVVRWHRTMYVPAAATLLLVGDVTADEARQIARQAFGSWRGAAPRLVRKPNPSRPAQRTRVILVDRPGSVQSHIRVGQAAPGAEDPDVIRLTALTQVLGGAFNARINQNLRERHGWTYGAWANFNPARGAGTLFIHSSVRTNATDSALVESVREYRRIVEEPVPAEELTGATGNLVGSFPASVQTVQGLAQRMQNLLVWGLPMDYYATYREQLAAVAPGDVTRVGGARLTPGAATIVVAGDLAQIEAPIRALNLGDVEVWSPAGERVR
ncbi:MAG TPA: pitrilysin family protein [Longimicrobium sp.]|jgi:zinc protease|uniref:M16 family metallopeptidase n=1 Tax=Longimicrobium sp. TaxID=2029185 RepID=UPI002ED9F5E2